MKMALVLVSLFSSAAFAETVFVSDRVLMYPGGSLERYTMITNDIYWKVRDKKLCEKGIVKISNVMIQVDAEFSVDVSEKEGVQTQAQTYPTVTYNASVECKR